MSEAKGVSGSSTLCCLVLDGTLVSKYKVGKGIFFVMVDVLTIERCGECHQDELNAQVASAMDEQESIKQSKLDPPSSSDNAPRPAIIKEFDSLLKVVDFRELRQHSSVLCRVNVGVADEYHPTVVTIDGAVPQPMSTTLNKQWHTGDRVRVHCIASPLNDVPMAVKLCIVKRNDGWSFVAPPPPMFLPKPLQQLIQVPGPEAVGVHDVNEVHELTSRRQLRLQRNYVVAKRVLDSYYTDPRTAPGEHHTSSDEDDEASKLWSPAAYRQGKVHKSRRGGIFAAFVRDVLLPPSLSSERLSTSAGSDISRYPHVVDVAGGKGAVAAALLVSESEVLRCTVIDPWPRRPLEELVKTTMPEGRCVAVKACLDNVFLEPSEAQELFRTAAAVVGMHPDQATEPIVDVGMRFRIPFAVVPCCVFPAENTHRRLPPAHGGGRVETTADFVLYLKAKIEIWMLKETAGGNAAGTLVDQHLGFGGRDRVIGWIPARS